MKQWVLVVSTLLLAATVWCQVEDDSIDSPDWPKMIEAEQGNLTVYQPQLDSLVADRLYGMAAVSWKESDKTAVFGAMWFVTTLAVDRTTRRASIESVNIFEARFPEDVEIEYDVDAATKFLTEEVPKWDLEFSMEELVTSLEASEKFVSEGFNDAPPEIIYRTEPAVLIMIDGEPQWQQVTKDVERIVNTPALAFRYRQAYYILGNGQWYTSSTTKDWIALDTPPKAINKALDELITKDAQKELEESESDIEVEIIVRTQPAELVQTTGEADLVPITGTNLLYVTNTESDILFDINRQQFYLLISGRWFVSTQLDGDWEFLPPTELPKDFAQIPEGNDKDVVLSNVPGTPANQEALMDAQVPQTAAIDRETASTEVQYDGAPQFEPIEETDMELAQNSDKQVIKDNGRYYCVDDGIWYESESPDGPWFVATKRPVQVDAIPASSSAYNVKYVYIYDVTPTYVYCGYLPAYTGTFIYYGVPVYGTGWWYRPWWGTVYYPRPATWGFSMSYNPWYGFSMGMHYTVGGPYFNFSIHFGGPAFRPGWGWHGGWFGCPRYRPPYRPPVRGWYGPRRPVVINNPTININNNRVVNNINRNNRVGNVYGNDSWGGRPATREAARDKAATRPGVAKTGNRPSTTDARVRPGNNRPVPQRPSDRPSAGQQRPANRPSTGGVSPSIDRGNLPSSRPTRPTEPPRTRPTEPKKSPNIPSQRDNIYSDNRGNTYRRDQGNWNQTRPSTQPSNRSGNYNGRNLNRDMQSRQRSAQRSKSYQSRPASRPASRPSGGRRGRG